MISPCVAFNNHEGSTKSFDYVREHNKALNALDYVPGRAPIEVEYAEGAAAPVELHDGTTINLRKLAPTTTAATAPTRWRLIEHHRKAGEIADRPAVHRQRS